MRVVGMITDVRGGVAHRRPARPPRKAHGGHRILGLHLDPDVELVGVSPSVAGAARGSARIGAWHVRQLASFVRIAELVVEDRRLGDEVQLLAHAHLLDREATSPDDEQVVPPVGIAAGLADLRERADRRERDRPFADLAAIPDQDDAERQRAVDAIPDEFAVTLLEDVERKRDAGTENGVKREERELEGGFHR